MTKSTGKQAPVTPPPDAVFISAKQLRNRYGARSAMWLHRRKMSDSDFPKPTLIGRLNFYKITDVEAYERGLVTRDNTATSSRGKAEAGVKASV
jgi:hypothetical protein